jgi:hypothetical protein
MNYPKQSKNKVFPHAPYDMYSHFSPVMGYFVDDDNKSETFGKVLFGQIGERNDFEFVQSFKDDCDMTLIKQQLLAAKGADDFSAEFIDDEVEEENAEVKDENTSNPADNSNETTVKD